MNLKPVVPFEPISVTDIPQGTDWVAQIKWDGVRMLCYYDGLQARLYNRKCRDRTRQYPEFNDPTEFCRANSFILDGEFIAFNGKKPSFQTIMKRENLDSPAEIISRMSRFPVTYMIFDLLYLNGSWRTDLPLSQRQDLLEQIIEPNLQVQLCVNYENSAALFDLMKKKNLEGIVCKSLSSKYTIGYKDQRWQKKKRTYDLLAAIGGFTVKEGKPSTLLLGLFANDGTFHFIGNVGPGKLNAMMWAKLMQNLLAFHSKNRPFISLPDLKKATIWLQPKFVVKVQFLEWTATGQMRHAVLQSEMPTEYLSACTMNQT